MYLLNVQNFQPRLFLDEKARPPYAILSHTWNSDDEEVGFGDLRRYHQAVAQDEPSIVDSISSRLGFKKIERFCNVAKSHGLEWAWVDTCCIDKRSSAGLSEAINSMFKWYRDAERCCVFLQDVTGSYNDPSFRNSRWFSRGWTLQELIAPKLLYFYDQQWELIGMIHDSPLETTHDTPPETTHNDPPETMDGIPLETVDGISTLCEAVSSITSIPIAFLKGAPLADACVAKKMSWASKRQTTRPEDIAYSLLGIFDINMPLLYGEGHRAFIRLQEAIISNTQDHSILAWGTINESKSSWFHISSHIPPSSGLGALAASPADFEDCGDFEAADVDLFKTHSNLDFQVTPGGVKLGVNIYVSDKFAVCELSCFTWRYPSQRIKILLRPGPLSLSYSEFLIKWPQHLRQGRNLWCNSVSLLIMVPSYYGEAAYMRLLVLINVFGLFQFFLRWLRRRSQTIIIVKDTASSTMHSIQSRFHVLNCQNLALLNIPNDHTFNIEYAHSSFRVETNIHQIGRHSLHIIYPTERADDRPLLIPVYVAYAIATFIGFTLFDVGFRASFVLVAVGLTFFTISSNRIIPIYAWNGVTAETTPAIVFRRMWMFMLGEGAGPRVDRRAIRVCIRIMDQRSSSSSNDTEQILVTVCFYPRFSVPFSRHKVTCHLVQVPMVHSRNEENHSIGLDRWPKTYKTLETGRRKYAQHTQRFKYREGGVAKFLFTITAKEKD